MSRITVTSGAFETLQDAVKDIGERKLWPYSLVAEHGATYRRHHHETDEMLYLIDGSLVFTDVDDREYPVTQGNRLHIPEGVIHSVRTVDGATYLMGLTKMIALEKFPIWEEQEDVNGLDRLNKEFGEAELGRNAAFFDARLGEDFLFHRADGTVVDKAGYVEALIDPENVYEFIHSNDVNVMAGSGDEALVSLRVSAKGVRKGKPFHGMFRNTRLFVKRQGQWRCVRWFNKPAEGFA